MPVGSIFELLHVNYRGYVIVVITRNIRKASPLYNFRVLCLLRILLRLGASLIARNGFRGLHRALARWPSSITSGPKPLNMSDPNPPLRHPRQDVHPLKPFLSSEQLFPRLQKHHAVLFPAYLSAQVWSMDVHFRHGPFQYIQKWRWSSWCWCRLVGYCCITSWAIEWLSWFDFISSPVD